MANPNDRYRNVPAGAGGLHYSASFASKPYADQQQYLRSRGSSLDNGEDMARAGQPGNAYSTQYGDIDQTGLQRSQSTAQQPGSYFGSQAGNNDGSGYTNQPQPSEVGYSAGYQQQQGYESAPYPTTAAYNSGQQPSHRPPYNPAAYTGPQRHASTATGGYASSPPQYSPNTGTAYNPSTFNTAPYPTTFASQAKVPAQQPYYGGVASSGYNQYSGRTQYTPQPQQTFGVAQQVSPYPSQSAPAQTAYRPPPPPPPHPPNSPTTTAYGPSTTYGGQTYNTLPYPSQDTHSYPSQTLAAPTRPETHYSSDSEISLNGNSPGPPIF